MRRVLLFAAFLLLLGLTTATAASFDVQAEDITSFSESVTIVTPPPSQPVPLPPRIFVRGESASPPGQLELSTPAQNDSVQKKLVILRSPTALFDQAAQGFFFTWQTVNAPTGGYLLKGSFKLSISMFGGQSDSLTAGLLDCPASAAPSSLAGHDCKLIAVTTSGPATRTGLSDVTADFGSVPTTVIPAGRQLRLKIVNRTVNEAGGTISTRDWELQWGYLPSRQSLLEVTP